MYQAIEKSPKDMNMKEFIISLVKAHTWQWVSDAACVDWIILSTYWEYVKGVEMCPTVYDWLYNIMYINEMPAK